MSDEKDPFYALYNGAGFVPGEVAINGFIALICFVGMALNASLVHVSTKTKSLHSHCNVLIALYAFSASFLLLGFTFKFFIFLFGFNYVSLRFCLSIQLLPIIGSAFTVALQIAIGLDRLCGVIFPFWYKGRGKYIVFKLLLALCCLLAAVDVCNFYLWMPKQWEMPVMCRLGNPARHPENNYYFNALNLGMYFGEFCCYVLIWLISWWRKAQISENGRRLMLSLSVIMSIGFFCYIGNVLFIVFVAPLLGANANEFVASPICCAIFVFAYTSSAPVLCACSTEYRRAFRKTFLRDDRQSTRIFYMRIFHQTKNENRIVLANVAISQFK
ncbi:hypothetical protein niasHT_010326 [Heterodera trifolii]|uniref:G_PROTEIN_RECEP_F1_2 domain-containing protein n=1 Tax=Heterodera trifolii TaxID=157864 RepID=A0ABD2M5X4_9BILA